jgi:hypothetical protein
VLFEEVLMLLVESWTRPGARFCTARHFISLELRMYAFFSILGQGRRSMRGKL